MSSITSEGMVNMRKFDELRKQKQETFQSIEISTQRLSKIADESNRVADIACHAGTILSEIDRSFAEKTKLSGADIKFLFFAVALQCIRQYVISPFEDRENDKVSAKDAKKEEKRIFENSFWDSDSPNQGQQYYASLEDIIGNPVPYDTQFGSMDFNLNLSGKAHRFRTLGHDPLLGWVFGTSNIMTSTLTDWTFSSYHVANHPQINGVLKAKIVEKAHTELMLQKAMELTKTNPILLAAAIIKQRLHLKSDEFSIMGLPVPVVSTLSPNVAQRLAEYGFDFGNIKIVAKQAAYSTMINALIAMIHRLFYDEARHKDIKLYEVRTRKILLYSNLIASASNVLLVAGKTFILKDNNAMKYLDVGGILVTLYRLISDYKFIQQIKQEFLHNEFNRLIQGEEYEF